MDLTKMTRGDLATLQDELRTVASAADVLAEGGQEPEISLTAWETAIRCAPLAAFGRFGTSPGRMVTPVATAEGPRGMLLVLDQMRHKVMAFDGQHEFLDEFGSIGDAPGDFYHPVSMATDAAGRLYVAQGYRSRVQVFSVLADGAVE